MKQHNAARLLLEWHHLSTSRVIWRGRAGGEADDEPAVGMRERGIQSERHLIITRHAVPCGAGRAVRAHCGEPALYSAAV